MIHDNGVMKMRERDGVIEIPAGETLMLKPGGLHMMFMGLGETMVPGEMREITLEFASGYKMTVTAVVLKAADIKSDVQWLGQSDEDSASHKHKHLHD